MSSMKRADLFSLLAALLLVGCGGSGGDDNTLIEPDPPNTIVNPSLSISDATVTEDDDTNVTLSFTVQASFVAPAGATIADARVSYATASATAESGVDFLAASGTLDIPGGTSQVTVDIEIVGDRDQEADETFTVTLSSPENATIVDAEAIGTIRDNDSAVAASGLDSRPDNQTCIAPDRPTTDASVVVTDPYPALQDFSQPTKLLLEPGNNGRWFVLQKSGQILTFDPANATSATEYLDLTDTRNLRTNSEGGLLGMAFHPNYPATPEVFLSYTIQNNNPSMRSVIARWIIDDMARPGAAVREEIIIEIDQDFDNHNGGDIAFGPDGFLYIGLGDGGSGNDPRARAQDNTRLLGAMLRLDVNDTGAGYNIPADNPFAGNPPCGPGGNANDCPEIFAWGLRNPWRWAFDRDSGALWLADVGQGAREEVNLIERGGNYGWRCREGTLDTGNASDCDGVALIDPVTEYPRSQGNSITGGQVYRGDAMPALSGLYVFGDYGSGRIWATQPDGQGGFTNAQLIDTNLNPTAFAIGPDNELYMVDINGSNGRGRVRRLDAANTQAMDTIPDQLSATGCVDTSDASLPYSGLLRYSPNAPFWSDGADKDRYIAIPNGTTIDINAAGDFAFPIGTVLVKNFRLNGALIETRHFMRHTDGEWAGYTYEWNAAQTEATRVRGGKVARVEGQDWIYPSESECMACHTSAAGFSLGAEIAQLNKDITYPETGRFANQLETLAQIGMLTNPLSAPASTLPALADPENTGSAIEPRARAYLHTNCSQCHRPNGPAPSDMDLRFDTPLASMNACDVEPTGDTLGIDGARLIAPGDSAASMIIERMQRRDVHGMPPIGSNRIDTFNVARVAAWIDSLSGCN
ncbi:MAG: PQQ-dependent sugar dehydrogenase [Pseudomonadota bacterium]